MNVINFSKQKDIKFLYRFHDVSGASDNKSICQMEGFLCASLKYIFSHLKFKRGLFNFDKRTLAFGSQG